MKLKYYHIILITFLSLLINQIFIQYRLAKKNDDAAILNIAGRQRMLSQRINLEYYKIVNEISPNLQVIKDYINSNKTISKAHLSAINKNQTRYLEKMEAIVKMLEARAKDKLTFIRIIEVVMMLGIMLIILIEIIFFYRPLYQEKDKSIEDLRQNNNELEAILNNSNDAIVYRDLKTKKILKSNKKLLKMFGVDSIEKLNMIDAHQFLPDEPIEGISRKAFFKQLNESLKKKGKYEANLWINNLKGVLKQVCSFSFS